MSDISVRGANAISNLGIGIHANISEGVYHSDPCEEISASASILRTLYDYSPEHAAYAHPRINLAFEPGRGTDAQNTGSILHAAVLGQPQPYRVIHEDSFRSNASKAARDNALADGLIPILAHKLDEILPVADALRDRLRKEHPEIWEALTDPETLREATVVWRENGVMCRCRYDILPPAKYKATYDLKFTVRSTEPGEWSRKLRQEYLFQPEFYSLGIKATRGDRPEFRLIACETDPPHGVSIHAPDVTLQHIASRRLNVALRRWKHCLREGRWPGYSTMTHYAEAPTYLLTQDEAMASHDNFLADAGVYGEDA